jgi:hypothetical protein
MRAPNARTTSHAAIMTIKGAIGYYLLIRGSGSEADTPRNARSEAMRREISGPAVALRPP